MKHEKNKNNKWKYISCCIGVVLGLLLINGKFTVCAADTLQNMTSFSGVMISPDGTAWTTDYMDKTCERLPEGYTFFTGRESKLRSLQAGEHYYGVAAKGEVSVGKWVVAWSDAQGIHNYEAQNYKGFQVNGGICEKYYNNGWMAYCADCGDTVVQMLVYGKSGTIQGITSMPAKSAYVYICPHCHGLEQGVEYQHICKEISYNYYKVSYEKNAPADAKVQGYMAMTKHMYNNAALYEGVSAAQNGYSDTRLRKNSYKCDGYIFCGWNTEADGSGQSFFDAQAVINLSEAEGDTVTLYAQWERASSMLFIDANGGTYGGEEIYSVSRQSQTAYLADPKLLVPAEGYLVEFEENGGTEVSDIYTTKSFTFWKTSENFKGEFKDNVYIFPNDGGNVDSIQAQYVDEAFTLPDITKENQSLVGWYKDADFSDTAYVGKPGDAVCVSEDTVLYAKWELLILWSDEDYSAYNGVGAVDLAWEQKDGQSKYYKLYQSLNQKDWTQIYTADMSRREVSVQEYYDIEKQGEQYIVPHTGYYKLSASGAKGGNLSTAYFGGKGGSVSAEFWLEKGDILTFYAGEKGTDFAGGSNGNGANGGNGTEGRGSGGGAATEIYVTKNGVMEPLLIAGGGSGAGDGMDGKDGGASLTEPADRAGEDSEAGGGGGGAIGGKGGISYYRTTLHNPAVEDIALKSEWSQGLQKGTQVYYIWKEPYNLSPYPQMQISASNWEIYFQSPNISVGGLTKEVTLAASDFTEEESHFGDELVKLPEENTPLMYNCYQVSGGFTRKYIAEYPTNGNTNVVVSGYLYAWGNSAIKSSIRFRILDADTGELLHDEKYVDGYATINKEDKTSFWEVGVWDDFDVEGTENVQVEVWIYGETDQAHFRTKVLDTFFYGKKIGTSEGAEGGSSYINPLYGCKNSQYEGGTNADNGYAQVESIDVGFLENTTLEDVLARDMDPPEKVMNYSVQEIGGNRLSVSWETPKDLGTVYYHKAESYGNTEQGVKYIATSNITENTLTSGVEKYFYYVDTNPIGKVTKEHAFTSLAELEVESAEEILYLHMAAEDVAGNLGDTADIELKPLAKEPEEVKPENIELLTKQMQVKDTDFVYIVNEKLCYVKADGKTEHTLYAESYLSGLTKQDFQIDRLKLCMSQSENQEWMQVSIPHGNITLSEQVFTNDLLQMEVSSHFQDIFQPEAAAAVRRNHGVSLELEQNFVVDERGLPFEIYPQAIAGFQDDVYISNLEQDVSNGVTVIPDGVAPVIAGLEALQNLKVLDMTENSLTMELTAADELSGLAEFIVYIKNCDNHMQGEFLCDEWGRIQLEIHKDDPLFIGEIEVSAIAVDRVGNGNVIGEDGLTFTLDTKLYRERNPEQSVFKAGDGAILEIETSGYVECVEVIFPEDMLQADTELNKVYVYEHPYLRKAEIVQFHVPLDIEEKEYEIIVNAYKNEQMLTGKPTMIVVKGMVLDELRTRIRNNG